MKVSLKEIKQTFIQCIASQERRRKAIYGKELEAELLALNPENIDDAFIFEKGVGDPKSDKFDNHTKRVRSRIKTIAKRHNLKICIRWTVNGECVVSLKQQKGLKQNNS